MAKTDHSRRWTWLVVVGEKTKKEMMSIGSAKEKEIKFSGKGVSLALFSIYQSPRGEGSSMDTPL